MVFCGKHLIGSLSSPPSACKESSAEQQYEEAREVETSALDFQQQMSDVGHFILGGKQPIGFILTITVSYYLRKISVRISVKWAVPIGCIEGKTRNTIQLIEITTEQYKPQCNNIAGTQCPH